MWAKSLSDDEKTEWGFQSKIKGKYSVRNGGLDKDTTTLSNRIDAPDKRKEIKRKVGYSEQ